MNNIVHKSQQFVEDLFSKKLSSNFYYHDWHHTISVKEWAIKIGEARNLNESDLEVLTLAALFHDTGFTHCYQGHENKSLHIAQDFFKTQNYPADQLKKILSCIEVTKITANPTTELERIMKDADLHSIGTNDFFKNSQNLRKEWKDLCDTSYSNLEWFQNDLDFWEAHSYFTPEAQTLLNKKKKKNIKKVKQMLEKELKKIAKLKSAETISGNRSAQMMFKVALRNHIDLTNIADNKANIMLTINMAVLTFVVPFGVGSLSDYPDYPYLKIPLILLALTSLLTIIYATLATRPIKMMGKTSPENLATGKTNLFFFGNFYNMNLPDYQEGIRNIIKHEDRLEKTIINDLYFLGKALGNKYNQLRNCYVIFVVGITITVFAFAFSFYFTT